MLLNTLNCIEWAVKSTQTYSCSHITQTKAKDQPLILLASIRTKLIYFSYSAKRSNTQYWLVNWLRCTFCPSSVCVCMSSTQASPSSCSWVISLNKGCLRRCSKCHSWS
mmetsp:Transcript_32256/g.55758  ORF Transcript_32256/g.55758 Transcript_32256/m.55758 type:complete len:109 (-) Transcript_32256:660-986(-)